MRALITGILGFAGRHLARHLVACGDEVHGIARRAVGGLPGLEDDRIVPCDVLDAAAVKRAVARAAPQVIYHLAAAANPVAAEKRADETSAVNVDGTAHMLAAMAAVAPAARLILVSSGAVYGDAGSAGRGLSETDDVHPVTVYGRSKVAAEACGLAAARMAGLDVVIARPFNHTGPGQERTYLCSEIAWQVAAVSLGLAPPFLRIGDLTLVRDMSDVRDVVTAYRILAEKGRCGEIYNVASGTGSTIGEIVELARRSVGHSITVLSEASRHRAGDAAAVFADISKLERITGPLPRRPLEQTLRDLLADWRHRLAPRLAAPEA